MGPDRAATSSVWLTDHNARSVTSPPPRPSLSRARLVSTAVTLLDEAGLDKFSMRQLAGRLSVTAMSLYWYVDNKDDLLELALDEVLGTVHVPGAEEGATGVRTCEHSPASGGTCGSVTRGRCT